MKNRAKLAWAAELQSLQVVYRSIDDLRPYPGNARTHPTRQIKQIAAAIQQFGFLNPVLVDKDDTIIAGHGRIEAARTLGLREAPTIRIEHLSEAQRRAYILADNRLAELAGWDSDTLKIELQYLDAFSEEFSVDITGFDTAFLDNLSFSGAATDEEAAPPAADGVAITQSGDLWLLGDHRLYCGDARDPVAMRTLMQRDRARMVFTDPPYNVKIDGHVTGLGRVKHREFMMGAGEMSSQAFTRFLEDALVNLAHASLSGAIHFICMDWRHLGELLEAGSSTYGEPKNLIVWVKDNAGMGSFYRSQHELIAAFKYGEAAHVNNFGLGERGRYRTNVWNYAGANSVSKQRLADLAMHPTVKPTGMVADAIRDVSHRGEIVLDAFGGSGTTLIAAHNTRRRARLLELDPLYCDVIVRRFEAATGIQAAHGATGTRFSESSTS